jgi:hypothetical protein
VPSKSYLGLKQEEIDENEPRAETLKNVTSREDQESTYLTADVSPEGLVKIKKGIRDGKLPTNSEELRAKHKLVGHCWLFLKLKHTNRVWLSDLDERSFVHLSDYLLGKHVNGVSIACTSGKTHHPPWSLILTYELEIRRKAYELVTEGVNMGAALKTVMDDAGHRERYFLAPFTLGASSLPAVPNPSTGDRPSRGRFQDAARRKRRVRPYSFSKGHARGGKGTGKGKGGAPHSAQRTHHKHAKTEDGKDICFRWNDGATCTPDCRRVHVCSGCRGPHRKKDCRHTSGH